MCRIAGILHGCVHACMAASCSARRTSSHYTCSMPRGTCEPSRTVCICICKTTRVWQLSDVLGACTERYFELCSSLCHYNPLADATLKPTATAAAALQCCHGTKPFPELESGEPHKSCAAAAQPISNSSQGSQQAATPTHNTLNCLAL